MEIKSRITTHRIAFWSGVLYILAGVGCHIPEFLERSGLRSQPAGMPMMFMEFGMLLIVAGIGLAAYGLFPVHATQTNDGNVKFQLHALDNARLGWAHWQLVAVLGIALVVDVMKPATIGFVVPGMRREYGISTSEVSLLAFFAMIGTTVGSIVWGVLADRLGRRGSILLAALIFVSTGICGCMPAFKWNLVMCLFMGLSAGGLLPIVFALLAEMVPARHRGWLSVLVGGLGSAGGYLAASGAAAWLEPLYTWRILWLLNIPTGLLVVLLSRYIPESPRFLLQAGRVSEAQKTLARFDVELIRTNVTAAGERAEHAFAFKQLLRKPYALITFTVCFYGMAWGLVNWGFLTWLPTILQDYLKMDDRIANRLLAEAALIAVPGCAIVAWLYGFWSSKRTMVFFALATAIVLGGFSIFKPGDSQAFFTALTVMLLIGLSGMIAMLSPYSAELYPTRFRATGGGVAASSSKIGGVVGPSAVAIIMTVFPGLVIPALSLAIPLLLAAIILWVNGKETSGKRLEEIQGAPVETAEVLE
ncbi:MAG TPA: MFS transporter [Verrucomicrobiae bacterium]|nr:MFS transporter [Verrucomicrobiae bacterium]